jgi:fusaric acid resistance family protein
MTDVASPPPDLPKGSRPLARILPLDLRRGTLSLVSIGVPIATGVISGQASAGLVGGITGLLLSLSDTEGSLVARLGTTAGVALGIGIGGLLGAWLASVQPIFWIVFFAGIFAAGLLNQVGKGPHFAVRFGAIAFAVIVGLPELAPETLWYFAGTVALCLIAKLIDQRSYGPLPDGPPWPGSIAAPLSHWLRFALAYAIAASAGLWIGVQSGSVRAVWTAAIVLVFMLPDIRLTYARIVQGVIGATLAVLMMRLLNLAAAPQAVLLAAILFFAFILPSQLPRFWLFSGLTAAIVLMAWALASGDPTLQPLLLWERFEDTLIAAGLAISVTLLFFPRESWSALAGMFGRAPAKQ